MKGFLTLLFVVNIWNNLFAEDLISYDYEVDAYYSKALMFINLDEDNNITDALNYAEEDIYKDMFLNTFNPNVLVLEVSLHPMSLFGLYFRQNHESTYERSKTNSFNPVKVITAGFEEPYSFSFFVGRMMVFKNKKDSHIGNNRAYMGFLLRVGDYSIKDNLAHYDKWYNIEYKLQGTRKTDERDLDWSFRVGTKIHQNSDFANSIFIEARRSSIDYKKSEWSFIYNSAFSSMFAISSDTLKLTEAELMLEKKWPLSLSQKISFGLSIGYLYNTGEKYKGALKEEGIDRHQLILRPNFKW
ncbi:hypothetical protein M947_05060 [Sulfurimonas hongkongensis]|uniref:Uncharacterized protein n=1 Tax=Sulfurimonas hongkongensis TaxID=1172190 RepID=T0JFV3_9BACT|nr:hypothetical protein [Sulfurimonas hongkongensis]EQB39955.1 hypothetical protein M947_05060 [Sulfurimonas hongkongensis]